MQFEPEWVVVTFEIDPFLGTATLRGFRRGPDSMGELTEKHPAIHLLTFPLEEGWEAEWEARRETIVKRNPDLPPSMVEDLVLNLWLRDCDPLTWAKTDTQSLVV